MSCQPSPNRADRDQAHGGEAQLDGVVTALLTASRALVGVAAESLTVVSDRVTVSQFRTLVVLDTAGASALGALADRLGVNASTALRQVDRLVAADLVDRRANPDDRRQVLISLTPAGHALVGEVTHRRRIRVAGIVRTMAPDVRDELVEALVAFADAAGEPLVGDVAALGWAGLDGAGLDAATRHGQTG